MRAHLTAAALIAVGTAFAIAAYLFAPKPPRQTSQAQAMARDAISRPSTFAELIALTPEQLMRIDLARANLLCAEGLPGSEGLDVEACLRMLDHWARRVHADTVGNFRRFIDNPAECNHSLAEYHMGMLITVLQKDLGVRYADHLRGWEWPFTDSRNFLIHGMLGYGTGGSCASMPVLYAAIAHRLGYPVFLVKTKGHVFCRWNGSIHGKPAERVNIEGASDGFHVDDDDHYRTWPTRLTPEEEASGAYLRDLNAVQSIAGFIASRAACFEDLGRPEEAIEAYLIAARFDPTAGIYARTAESVRRGIARLARLQPTEEIPRPMDPVELMMQQQQRLSAGPVLPGPFTADDVYERIVAPTVPTTHMPIPGMHHEGAP